MNINLSDIFIKIMDSKFYQTIISIFLTFITYFFFDNVIEILKRFGGWSRVFIFILWLLIIELIVLIYKKIKSIQISRFDKKYMDVQAQRENKQTLEKLWTIVDGMSKNEKNNLIYFLKNNNKPLLTGNVLYNGTHLLNSEWVHKSVYSGNEKITEKFNVIGNVGNTYIEERTYSPSYQYILKDHLYEALKYSLETYGRISHFDKI